MSSVVLLVLAVHVGVAICMAASPDVEKTAAGPNLVICGGGVAPAAAIERFRKLAGPEPRLVVIPTAGGDEVDEKGIRQRWRGRGFDDLVILHSTDRKAASSDEFVKPLTTATAVWFSGGYQQRLAALYVGTRVETEIYKLIKRGGVVGGSSAGAAIQSRVMISGAKPDVSTGLDLLPDAIVDQHFLARNRLDRLLTAVRAHPTLTGYGIDERTALVLSDSKLEVVGGSYVVRIRSRNGTIQMDAFKQGDTLND